MKSIQLKPRLFILAIPTALFLISCTLSWGDCVDGKGDLTKKELDLNGFSEVGLQLPANVYITQGKGYKVEVEAQENIHDVLHVNVSGKKLKVETQKGKCIGKAKTVSVWITTPTLDAIAVAGSGDVEVKSSLESDNLDLSIAGSGDIQLGNVTAKSIDVSIAGSGDVAFTGKGAANNFSLSISGSGDYAAQSIVCADAKVSIAGSGSAKVYATDNLDVSISGSGDVEYAGEAKLKTSIGGSGEVNHRDW